MTLQVRHHCEPVGKDKIVAYFFGVIGVSCIVFTLFGSWLKDFNPDILYVDKETLDVKRSGRYAVLVTKRPREINVNDEVENIYINGTDYDIRNNSKKAVEGRSLVPNYITETDALSDQHDRMIKSTDAILQHKLNPQKYVYESKDTSYQFVIPRTKVQDMFMSNKRRNTDGPCNELFENNVKALIDTTLHMNPANRMKLDNNAYRKMTQNCSEFKNIRQYINSPLTQIETDFPLAYSIVAYKRVEQIERLLRAIYRPQNHYCIHMDSKSAKDDIETIQLIVSCFSNVHMSSRSVAVKWGTFSVLEAELVCMSDMWNKTWRYFINLTGQEFPLKTNLEIVKILTAMKEANLVDGTWVRARENYLYRWTKNIQPPPHNIRPIKGSVHIAVNRDFVDFALHDLRSKDFLQWLNLTDIPDETFFSSLNHNPHLQIPGSFLGEPEEYPKKPTFTRYKNWEIGHGTWVRRCAGKYVRNVCILGVGDLFKLKDDISLFANKFYLDFQYLAYECLEELIYNRTRDQYLKELPIDVSFYEALDQVRYQLVKNN